MEIVGVHLKEYRQSKSSMAFLKLPFLYKLKFAWCW